MEGKMYLNTKHNFFARLLPARWSLRTTRCVSVGVFLVALSAYIFFGFQPTLPVDAANYPTLEIPSLSLSTPVAELELMNGELKTPTYIAGAYHSNDAKTLIIGHSSTVFSTLPNLQLHDTFTYNDTNYQITARITLAKNDISMLQILATAPRDTIILMTCAGDPLPNQDATHRLIITAEATV